MATIATTRKNYDYHIMSAYYDDHDEMVACIGTRKGCTDMAKKALMDGARYCEVKGCFTAPNGDTIEIVRETFSL